MAEGGGGGEGIADIIGRIALSWRARWLIVGVLLALTGSSLAMMYFGVIDEVHFSHWVEAGTYLLGIVFPVLMIVAVLALADGGDEIVQNRTFSYMMKTLPRILAAIEETGDARVPYREVRRRRLTSRATVLAHQYTDSCVGRYEIVFSDGRRLLFHLELNVRKANLLLLVPRARLLAGAGEGTPNARIEALLTHSITGATMEGYKVNSKAGHVDGEPGEWVSLVLVRTLDPRFLNSPYERVYFAQDLMFFLKSVVSEAPELFACEPSA